MTENITKKWKDITVEDLIRLNYLELKSASKIGEMYGVSGKVVASKKSKFGLTYETLLSVTESTGNKELMNEVYRECGFKNKDKTFIKTVLEHNHEVKMRKLVFDYLDDLITEKGFKLAEEKLQKDFELKLELLENDEWYELYKVV